MYNGGTTRNRTGVHGFAIRCVTTPPWCHPKERGIDIESCGCNAKIFALDMHMSHAAIEHCANAPMRGIAA